MKADIYIPEDVEKILKKLEASGYEAYIVGGCVRDNLLQRKPNDYDINTNAKPEKVAELFDKVVLTGIKHGTVTVIMNKEPYEVTTYRVDGEYEDGRHPENVKFVTSLKEDLARRDFTINAMAYNNLSGLQDYFDGQKDLKNKIIKTVGNPILRFTEDALRMLRAVRFSSQLGFKIESNTLNAIKMKSGNLKKISKERIREEFNKIILSNPEKIEDLRKCYLLQYIIPELILLNNEHNDLYFNDLKAAELAPKKLSLRVAICLYHIKEVLGLSSDDKSYTQKVNDSVSIHILKDLKYDNELINKVSILLGYKDYKFTDEISVKVLLRDIGVELTEDLIEINNSYALVCDDKDKINECIRIRQLLKAIIEENQCFCLKDLKINGADLIELGYKKGKEIGKVLNMLLSEVIKKPAINNKQDLIEILQNNKNI